MNTIYTSSLPLYSSDHLSFSFRCVPHFRLRSCQNVFGHPRFYQGSSHDYLCILQEESFLSELSSESPLMSIFLAQTSKLFHPLPITQSKTASMCLSILWHHSTLGIKICVSLVDCHNKFYRQSGFKKQNFFYNSSEGCI